VISLTICNESVRRVGRMNSFGLYIVLMFFWRFLCRWLVWWVQQWHYSVGVVWMQPWQYNCFPNSSISWTWPFLIR